jgi:hypothetical protein
MLKHWFGLDTKATLHYTGEQDTSDKYESFSFFKKK